MDTLTIVRIASIAAIAFAYMAFDLLNRRNVPTLFAYATVAYGMGLTLLYLNLAAIESSLLVAAVVFGLGYLVYRTGQIGLGDITELTAISLVLPFQAAPLLVQAGQYGLPFILSIVIASGVAALIAVPLFYIPLARKRLGRKALMGGAGGRGKALAIGAAYIIFIATIAFTGLANLYGIALLGVIMIGAVLTTLFERPITSSMVVYLAAGRLEPEDMLAMNMLSKAERASLKRKVKSFGQLVTARMIREMKAKRIRMKLPVYRDGIPFAVPIFIGVMVSLLLGNLIILAV
jgi:Flp pilus assembly protein protease CpaA